MSVDLQYFKLNSVNVAGRNLTPIVIPVIRDNDNKSPLTISFANWFDHLFSYSSQAESLTPLQLSHDKTNNQCFVELIHQPEKPTDFLLAFVNDNDNTPINAKPINGNDNSLLGSCFSDLVKLAKPHIEAFYHRILEKGKSYFIGRNQDCQIRLNDPCVSRHHARIDVDKEGKITITNLGSRNGTFVNDEKISVTTEIKKEDLVRFGNTTLNFSVKEDD